MSDVLAKWGDYPHFSAHEFDDRTNGENRMRHDFMVALEKVRVMYDKPMVITSGYRSPSHPIEAAKEKPGEHSEGMACDVKCDTSRDRFLLVNAALECGIRRIGIAADFIHLGLSMDRDQFVMWLY